MMMKLNLNDRSSRFAFQIGRRSGMCAANGIVDQLTEQLYAARREIAALRHELAQERRAAATRAVADAFARLQRSPETVLH